MVQAPSLPDQPFSPSVQIRLTSLGFAFISLQIVSASASESTFYGFIFCFCFDAHSDQIQLASASVDFTFRLVLLGIPLVLRAIPWIPFTRLGSELLVHQRRSTYPPRTKNLLDDGFLSLQITY